MSLRTNQRALGTLILIYNRLVDAEFYVKGEAEQRISNEADRLNRLIDRLHAKRLDDWLTKVPMLKTELRQINNKVQDAIDDIEDNLDTANKVVQVVGAVDDIVRLVAPLV